MCLARVAASRCPSGDVGPRARFIIVTLREVLPRAQGDSRSLLSSQPRDVPCSRATLHVSVSSREIKASRGVLYFTTHIAIKCLVAAPINPPVTPRRIARPRARSARIFRPALCASTLRPRHKYLSRIKERTLGRAGETTRRALSLRPRKITSTASGGGASIRAK